MSKGYILVDVPEKCSQCNFWFAKATEPVEYRCMAKQRKLQNLTGKPDWCPIRELPAKREVMGIPRNPSIGDGANAGFASMKIIQAILKHSKNGMQNILKFAETFLIIQICWR